MRWRMISPNELHANACRLMLGSSDLRPVTREDWYAVVACWSCNVARGLETSVAKLMAAMYQCPLSDWEVEMIATDQADYKNKRTGKAPKP